MVDELDPSTPPEVQAFWEGRRESTAIMRRLANKLIAIVGVLVLVLVTVVSIYLVSGRNTLDQDHAQIQQLNAKVECQNKAFNAILKDVRLAFKNDKNAADYAKAVTKC